MGGHRNGNAIWQHSVVFHDDSSQKVYPATEGTILYSSRLLFSILTPPTSHLMLAI